MPTCAHMSDRVTVYSMAVLSPSVPGRPLVDSIDPIHENSQDNVYSDLIVYEGTIVETDSRRFCIEGLLGSGTFSRVYEVSDISTNVRYAMKIGKSDANSRIQNSQEANFYAFMKHRWGPQLLSIDRCFEVYNHHCFVMERFGRSLFDELTDRRNVGMELSRIQAVLSSILQILCVLHEAGIIHADVKPENIVQEFDNKSRFKLIDYGLVYRYAASQTPVLLQTVYYRAPEVILGIGVDDKADMWSLGCVAAELFFGLPLFDGTSSAQLLYMMDKAVGPFPVEMVKSLDTNNRRVYFTRDFKMKDQRTLSNELGEEFPEPRFGYDRLVDNISMYRMSADASEPISAVEAQQRELFADLVLWMLQLNRGERCTARQALEHAFMSVEF